MLLNMKYENSITIKLAKKVLEYFDKSSYQ